MNKENIHGETKEDYLRDQANDLRASELRDLKWEILDLLPAKRLDELKEELINEIISEGWDNE